MTVEKKTPLARMNIRFPKDGFEAWKKQIEVFKEKLNTIANLPPKSE